MMFHKPHFFAATATTLDTGCLTPIFYQTLSPMRVMHQIINILLLRNPGEDCSPATILRSSPYFGRKDDFVEIACECYCTFKSFIGLFVRKRSWESAKGFGYCCSATVFINIFCFPSVSVINACMKQEINSNST